MKRTARWLALLVGAGSAAEAHAQCMAARVVLEPAAGATVPHDAILYLFVPYGETSVDVTTDGAVIERESLSRNGEIPVLRLRVKSPPGAQRLTVEVRGTGALSRTYELDDAAGGAPAGSVAIDGPVTRSRMQWTCSSEDALQIVPSLDAPAYRVEWASSREAYERGERTSTILPRSAREYFASGDEPLIKLGMLNCVGINAPTPNDTVYLGVVGLYADGSETKLPAPTEYREAAPVEPARAPAPAPQMPLVWRLMLAILLPFCLGYAGVSLALRRRAR